MLAELRVRNLGVIDDLGLVLPPGMTALTGETGAGKTLVVEAIELLVGGRSDATMVKPGCAEASVEGRFVVAGGGELVLSRVIPAEGRSRAYAGGRMASVAQLAELAAELVDLHGQHSHQALLSASTQRSALDDFGEVDTAPLEGARRRLRRIEADLAALGGDPRVRARELDLLRYQLGELDGAALDDPGEDEALGAEQERLAGATAHREAAAAAQLVLSGDEGAGDRLGAAVSLLAGHPPLASLRERLRALAAEVADAATEARSAAETLEDDPDRLAAVTERRQLLADLRRKYGDTVADVIAERDRIRARLDELTSHDGRAARLAEQRRQAEEALSQAERALGEARRAAAPRLSAAIEKRLRQLAMPRARFAIALGDHPAADPVTWMLAANPGSPPLPLAKVASGGELARTMLAARLVLLGADHRRSPSPPDGERTLVFDEVDAGIGGEAAVAVGRALAALGGSHQVLVVTHLPQVAAFADHQVAVSKVVTRGGTTARAEAVEGDARVAELSRMLSGQPASETAREHAAELLGTAAGERRLSRSRHRP